MNAISALKKETREFPCFFYIVRTQRKDSILFVFVLLLPIIVHL